MAQQEVNSILQGLQSAMGLFQQRQQLAQQRDLEQQRLDTQQEAEKSQADYRKAEADRFSKQMGLEQQRIDATHELNQAHRALLIQQATNNIMQGMPYPGDQATPGTLENGLVAPPGPGMPQTMVHNIPGMGQFELPTPEAHAQQMAQLQEIANGPAEAKAAAIQQSQEEQRLKTTQAQNDAKAQEDAKRFNFELSRQKIIEDAQTARNDHTNARNLQERLMTVTGGLLGMPGTSSDPTRTQPIAPTGKVKITTDPTTGLPSVNAVDPVQIIQNRLDQGFDWTTSIDKLKKEMTPAQVQYITGLAAQRGIVFPTDKELTNMKDLNDEAKMAGILKEMAVIRANQGGMISSLTSPSTSTLYGGTKAGQRFTELEQELKQYIPGFTRILANVRRFSAPEIENMTNSVQPSKVPWQDPLNGVDKYKNFIEGLQNDFNQVTGALSDAQKANVITKNGGANYPYLNRAMFQPGTNPGTPSNAPGIGEIPVIRKSDNQRGYLPLQQYNPKLYQLVTP